MVWVRPHSRSVRSVIPRLSALVVGLVTGVSLGEEQVADVSLERVVELARLRAPSITAARARTKQAEARTRLGSVPPDPELTLSGDRAEPPGGGPKENESALEVTQFLPSPRGVRARRRSGDAGVIAAEKDVEATIADVVLDAKRLYYEAAVAQAEANALAQAAADAKSLQEIMDRRVDLGESSEGDRLRTRVEALRTDLEARAASTQAEADRAALDRFLLGALGIKFTLSTSLEPTSLAEPPADTLMIAVERSPRYQAAQLRVESARWSVSAERALRLPGLSLSFFREREIDKNATGLTLGLTIPLWNRNEGTVLLAEAELAQLEAEAVQTKIEIEVEAERLARSARTGRELAVAYARDILPAASQALSIARFSLEQGEANLLSWLEARRSFLEILRASYRAQLEAFILAAELKRLLGGADAAN